MKRFGKTVLSVAVALLVAGSFVAGYMTGGRGAHETVHVYDGTALEHSGAPDATVWTCSMHPQIRLPEPGKCPICFMDLIPLAAEGAAGGVEAVSLRQIALSSEARKLAEVTVEPVARRPVSMETRMVGKVEKDETRLGYITTWMPGRIDKLFVDYTGSTVTRGQPMAEIYSPELLTAQAELIQAVQSIRKLEESGLNRVREAARQTEHAAREKLRLLGFTRRQIEEVILRGTPSDRITLHAPMGGVVIRKDVLEGMYVQTGTRIYTIADLSKVWVVLEAYESDLPWVKMGQQVAFQTEAFPGESFKGNVVYIDPLVNEKTRTVGVRLDVPNPGLRLKPGMFVRAVKRTEAIGPSDELVIPASAPLITGKRAIVYVKVPGLEGSYEGREVVLGPRAGNAYIVRSGLAEGELVVTKGNFRIDSAVQLQAKPSMMQPTGVAAVAVHDHGAAAPRTALRGATGAVASPVFSAQMVKLDGAVEGIRTAVTLKDLEKAVSAYRVFSDELEAVDATPLTGHPALVWKEAAMLLRNDALLGREADTVEEAVRLFSTLTGHYRIVQEQFPIDRFLESRALSGSVPASFRHEIATLLDHYLKLQEALAGDDFANAARAADRFAATLSGVQGHRLSPEALQVWKDAADLLAAGAHKAGRGKDIAALREGFERISVGLVGLIENLGVDFKEPLYEIFCPMAFDNRGATWLQTDEDIRNPYYGAMMLKCGEVRRKVL